MVPNTFARSVIVTETGFATVSIKMPNDVCQASRSDASTRYMVQMQFEPRIGCFTFNPILNGSFRNLMHSNSMLHYASHPRKKILHILIWFGTKQGDV
jgi:hypothetical protein